MKAVTLRHQTKQRTTMDEKKKETFNDLIAVIVHDTVY